MDFDYSPKVQALQARLSAFMDAHIYPNEARFHAEIEANRAAGNAWVPTRIMEEMKQQARDAGLWNLFLPDSAHGAGLTNLEYAPLCEIMGRAHFAPEVFNCSAPDTGNMEVLARYGTPEQQRDWLEPLLDGRIRSCFGMTEPDVASSDATNVATSMRLITRLLRRLWSGAAAGAGIGVGVSARVESSRGMARSVTEILSIWGSGCMRRWLAHK